MVDESYRLLAAQYLRKQIRQLRAQIEGIRQAEDLEYVHRARVASRRLRAALRMFGDCLPQKKLKGWRRAIKAVTKELGDARDKDVQVAFLEKVLLEAREQTELAGLRRLLVDLERQREELQPAVVEALDRLVESRILDKMTTRIKRMAKGLEQRGVTVVSNVVLARAEQEILAQLDDMLALEGCLADPEDVGQHHALRIACKRLRYAMEICRPAYCGRLDSLLEAVKEIQTMLGELHDCDVWIEDLESYLGQQQRRIVRLYNHPAPLDRLRIGIEYLRDARRSQRQQVFSSLVQHWRALVEQDFWPTLVEVVKMRPMGPPVSDRAPPLDPAGQDQGPPAVPGGPDSGGNGRLRGDQSHAAADPQDRSGELPSGNG